MAGVNLAEMNQTIMMLGAVERMEKPKTTLRDLFFPNVITFPTEKVEMNYRKGGRKIAPFVIDGFPRGVNVARETYQTNTIEPPLAAPSLPLTAGDLNQRLQGENIYSTRTPAQRAAEIRGRDLSYLTNMLIRSEEKMAADCLVYRSFTVHGYADDGKKPIKKKIAFPGDGKITLTGSSAWDQPGALILDNLEMGRSSVLTSAPDSSSIIGIGSPNTIQMILNNEAILKRLDIRNLDVGVIKPRWNTMPGLDYVGRLGFMEIYSYSAQYEDFEDGQTKLYLPEDYFIIGAPGQGRRLYGAITQLEDDNTWRTYEAPYVPKYWSDKGADVQMLRVASRPIVVPTDGNDYYTIKVR